MLWASFKLFAGLSMNLKFHSPTANTEWRKASHESVKVTKWGRFVLMARMTKHEIHSWRFRVKEQRIKRQKMMDSQSLIVMQAHQTLITSRHQIQKQVLHRLSQKQMKMTVTSHLQMMASCLLHSLSSQSFHLLTRPWKTMQGHQLLTKRPG